jgi:hypothetical protein
MRSVYGAVECLSLNIFCAQLVAQSVCAAQEDPVGMAWLTMFGALRPSNGHTPPLQHGDRGWCEGFTTVLTWHEGSCAASAWQCRTMHVPIIGELLLHIH